MADKTGNKGVEASSEQNGAATASPVPQQPQVPHMWNYQMYNMYGMYNMYNAYNHPYYQFLAQNSGYGGSPGAAGGYQQNSNTNPQMMAMEAYKTSFTSGGTLMPFNSVTTTSDSTSDQSSAASLPDKSSSSAGSKNLMASVDCTKVEEIELPPLPPGPPPPSVPPPPPPAPSPPPPPPPDTASPQHQQPAYPQYMGFNMNSQQMYNKSTPTYQQPFPAQNQYGTTPSNQNQYSTTPSNQNQYSTAPNNQNQQYMYQSQQSYNTAATKQQGYGSNGTGQQSSSGTRWSGATTEKETRWSQPTVRFAQPNRNSRFSANQQDGPIRFNMRGGRGRLKTPLLPNPEWKSNNKWMGSAKQTTSSGSTTTGTNLSDEETLRKLVDGWPDNLKSYVDRCFAECPPEKKDKMTVVLKSQLIKAAENGSLWCKQWQLEPLPQLDDEEAPKKKTLESRLGIPDSKSNPSGKKKKKDRSSRGRSSDGSDSEASNQDSYIGFTPASSSSSSSKKKNKNKDKKKNKYKHDLEESHYWSEFGLMNGGKVETKKEVLDKRAARFNSDKGSGNKQNKSRAVAQSRFEPAGNRLPSYQQSPRQPPPTDSFAMDVDTEFDLSTCHIVGTSKDIEKPYLRLTTAPEPWQVRPPEVLHQSLDRVKSKWVQTQDYRYVCEQLKSIRQDLTVQGIRDELTVLVYETHARIALETGDHAEFNQCQSQLSMLHREQASTNRHEFTAYRLLYYIFTQDFMDVNTMLMALSEEEKKNVCIEHAVNVMMAWLTSNYDRLFRLYASSPRMSSYLMDWFMPRERKQALKTIVKSYRPTIPTEVLISRLGFSDETKLMEFLEPLAIIYSDTTKKTIDCKQSTAAL